MKKAQRVIVCGDSVALAGIETSLGLDADCEVVGHCMPSAVSEMCELKPDVVIFELGVVPPDWISTLFSKLPRLPDQSPLLLIGVDLETNRAVLWTEQQAQGWTSRDLAQVIRRTGKTGPLGPIKRPRTHNYLSTKENRR